MTEERQCYYIVREGGSVSCYLKDNGNHRVLADTLDVELLNGQIALRDATIAELRAQVAERNADVARKDAEIAELQEWRDEAVSVAHARWLPPTDARSPIEIAPSVKVELHDYLMAQAPSGEGYSEFIKRALNLRRMLD